MKANPGGLIDPEFIFGREKLIQSIWDRLEQQCVLLNAERRIGKTSVLRKMVDQPADGWFAVFQDLEDIHTTDEFATTVYDEIQQYLSFIKKVANTARKIYEENEFGSVKKTTSRPWKKLLTASIEDLVSQQTDQKLVMFWDEVPYMIDNIRKAESEQSAAEVLDTLRKLRQKHADLRMVFTGSIGLHHVVSGLHSAKIATAPVNDMFAIEVTPLAPADARELAKALIEGENLPTSGIDEAAIAVADEAGYFPFYIHHIVSALKLDELRAEPNIIQELVQRQLVDANDPWELGHFRERIRIYYQDPQDAKLVNLILDTMATADEAQSLTNLLNAVNSQTAEFDDRDNLIRVLRLMERDHYLTRDSDGNYEFRFPLIRRWWKLDRGL